jgi:hypothetical protein
VAEEARRLDGVPGAIEEDESATVLADVETDTEGSRHFLQLLCLVG